MALPLARPVLASTRMPRGDTLRDLAAIVFLCAPLGLIWNYVATGDRLFYLGLHHLDVVCVTVLSVLSLLVTHLRRSRVMPATLSLRWVVLLRAVLNAPYLLLVLVYAVMAALPGFSPGPGMWVGLLGAFFAAQPRQAEAELMAPGDVVVRVVRRLVVGYLLASAGLLVAAALTGFFRVVTSTGSRALGLGLFNGVFSALAGLLLLAGVLVLCLLGLVRAVRRGRESLCLAGAAAGVIGVGLAVASSLTSSTLLTLVESGQEARTAVWGFPDPSFWVFVPLIALLTDPALRRTFPPLDGAVRWFGTAAILLAGGMVYGGYLWASVMFTVGWVNLGPRMAGDRVAENFRDGMAILALTGVAWGLTAGARRALRRHPRTSRVWVLVMLVAVAVLGVPVVLLGGTLPGLELSQQQPVFYLGLPLLVGLILLVPRPVRDYYAGRTATPVTASAVTTAVSRPAQLPATWRPVPRYPSGSGRPPG
ncbi:hypothetical protein GCM10022198_16430 [Klugiella xanthotipulae]|uniref:DUF7937 domain-containing protein n=1 Tax=Klugiella xanthotipulae TaxID=244735 RepID=A0A543HHA1_9MICO|nr:hypothetical protein [Klugiella xanthotipulae]TQM57679.1 hypothetical protein FB466_2675 [Klugiella xanthotipulae]